MDVTSLLNSSSLVKGESTKDTGSGNVVDNGGSPKSSTEAAAECSSTPTSSHEKTSSRRTSKTPSRRTSETKVPSRNRTPWDANGYALPFVLDFLESSQAPAQPKSSSTSPVDSGSPKSPRHKFSDSHSSLSSFASSASYPHSRISSMSTVGGVPPISGMPDTSSLETQSKNVEFLEPKHWSLGVRGRGLKDTKDTIMWPPTAPRRESLVTDVTRSNSPSDAMLMSISRGTQNADRTNRLLNVNEIRPGFGYLAPLDFTKAHKRATSAPNFTAIDTADRPYPPLPAFPQSTSSPAHRGESQPSYTMEAASPLAPMPSVRDDRIKCMYKENCDTGSQLRKAISHIFGRNKTCTRNIPPHVWVHFCRKHYQRSRYRNAHEWARVQCDLVQTQIQRVQEWSDENKKDGKPGIVQDWSLSMRKREQNRVQERSNRKRPYRDDSDDDGDSIPDNAILNGTAVPDWLRSKCADGYSTTEIQAIIARLKKEMEDTRMTQIPDIEILPNISMDTSNDARARPAMKRVTMARNNTHKKSHSVGVALGPESHSMARRTSQPSQLGYEDATRPSPSEKRQRMSHTSPYSDRIAQSNPKPSESSAQRSDLAPLRDMYPLPHRPAFGNIQESRAEDSYYGRENAGASSHNYGSWPAPTTQRHGSQSTVATLESNVARDYPSDRRNTHQRSFSDADNFQNGFAFRAPIGYPPNHVPEATAYGRGSMHPGRPHTPPTLAGYYDSYPAPAPRSFGAYQSSWPSPSSNHALAYPGHRHMRHQSTPSAPQTSAPQAPNVEYEYASGARTGATFEQSPQYHPRQRPYAPPRLYPNRIIESDQAKNIYSERR